MNGVELFVRRRVFAYMLSAAVLLFGAIALRGMGIDRMPSTDPPAVTVVTPYPGASPEVIDSSITSVIESAIHGISGIDYVRSRSTPGLSQIQVIFQLSRDSDSAFTEVQSKLSQIINELPREAEAPIVAKLDPNALPVMWLLITGDRPLDELHRIARNDVKKAIETIPGVGAVLVGGQRERKMRVDLDLRRMASLGVTIDDVHAAFASEHVQLPGGFLVDGSSERLLHLDLEYHSAAELSQMVVVWRDGRPLQLAEFATVRDALSDRRSLARMGGREGIAIGVQKVPQSNTVAIVDELERRLASAIRPALPHGVELVVASDEAGIVRSTVDALASHIVEGTLLAALVVWVFLLVPSSTLIITTAIPVSLAASLIVMYFGGYTFNIMTLTALLVLIGVVVDDAIVVLENIHRQHEAGNADPERAAIDGTNGVVLAVIAASMTLICIFATVMFLPGMVGVFLRSFAVVVVTGVVASLFVSLTLTPALSARFPGTGKAEKGVIASAMARFHGRTENHYRQLLDWCMRRSTLVLLITALTVPLSVLLLSRLGTEFFPQDDESRFIITLKAPLGSSINHVERQLNVVEGLLESIPEVRRVFSTIGATRQSDVNQAVIQVLLAPRSERERSQSEIMEQTGLKLDELAGVTTYLTNFPFVAGMIEESFEAYVVGPRFDRMAELANKVKSALDASEMMGNVRTDLELDRPLLSFDVDRSRARSLGVSARSIGQTLGTVAGGTDIARYNDLPGDGERYDVQLAAERSTMRRGGDLANVYLRGQSQGDDGSTLVRLDSLVSIRETQGPAMLQRYNLSFAAGFYSMPRNSLGEAVAEFRRVAGSVLPAGYWIELGGQPKELERSVADVILVFFGGMLLVYMVLASQFDSFLQPALVMLAQPLAIVGGLLALWLSGATLNLYSMFGLFLLVGLVSKNAILLVDLINRLRADGMDTMAAIRLGCPQRMRPVLMTSLTVILAMLPAAIGIGEGADQYGPLAIAVIGGMVSSTLLTLVVVPVAYALSARWLPVRARNSADMKASLHEQAAAGPRAEAAHHD